MGKLIRASHIPASIEIGVAGSKKFIDFHCALRSRRNAQSLKTQPFGVGAAAKGYQYLIEGNQYLFACMLGEQDFFAVLF